MNRFLILALALLAAPRYAAADIVDSGDLLIGGQAVIGGTLTVQGSSMSINGVSYGFPSTQGGDGQVLVNDGVGALSWAAGGSGGASGLILVSSWTVSGATSTTFSDLSTGTIYRMEIAVKQNSAQATYKLLFNSDTSSAYLYAARRLDSVSNISTLYSGGPDTQAYISYNSAGLDVYTDKPYLGGFTFRSTPGDDTDVLVKDLGAVYIDSNSRMETIFGGGVYYNGSSNLSSVTIEASAGSFTGTVLLFRFP